LENEEYLRKMALQGGNTPQTLKPPKLLPIVEGFIHERWSLQPDQSEDLSIFLSERGLEGSEEMTKVCIK